jgi:hypothetical protein
MIVVRDVLFPACTWSCLLKTLSLAVPLSPYLSPLLRASLPGGLSPQPPPIRFDLFLKKVTKNRRPCIGARPPFHLISPFLISVPRAPGGVKWRAKDVFEPRFEPQVRISSPPAVSPRPPISGVEMGGPQGGIRSSRNYDKVTKIQRQFPGALVLLHYKFGSSQMRGICSSFFRGTTRPVAQFDLRPEVCKDHIKLFWIGMPCQQIFSASTS